MKSRAASPRAELPSRDGNDPVSIVCMDVSKAWPPKPERAVRLRSAGEAPVGSEGIRYVPKRDQTVLAELPEEGIAGTGQIRDNWDDRVGHLHEAFGQAAKTRPHGHAPVALNRDGCRVARRDSRSGKPGLYRPARRCGRPYPERIAAAAMRPVSSAPCTVDGWSADAASPAKCSLPSQSAPDRALRSFRLVPTAMKE